MKPVLTLRQTRYPQGITSNCKLFSKSHTNKRLHGYNCNRNRLASLFLDVGEGMDEGGEEVGETFGGVIVEVASGAAHVAEHGRGVAVVDEDAVFILREIPVA